MKGLLFLGLLTTTCAERFRFTQCECQRLQFSSDNGDYFLFDGPLKVVGYEEIFKCPGDGAFPDESGVILSLGHDTGGLVARASDFLFKDDIGLPLDFYAIFQMAFTPVAGAKFDILSFWIKESSSTSPILSLAVQEEGKLTFLLKETELVARVKEDQERTYTTVVGQRTVEEGEDFESFLCVDTYSEEDGSKFECVTSSGISYPSEINFEIFSSHHRSAEMDVKVIYADIEDSGSNFLFKKLPILAETIDSRLRADVVNLPAPNHTIELSLKQSQVLDFNLFSLLSGGTLNSSELKYSVVTEPGNGVLTNEEFPLVKYTPNKDFNGNDLFRFKYEINSPFNCANEVDIRLAIEEEEEKEEEEKEERFDAAPIVSGIGGAIIGILLGIYIVQRLKSRGKNENLGKVASRSDPV